uniref:Uncharacterized protein n=1 Tax=Oryza barthii TaxID=65489 RepID=A0A0D3FVT1_9ORYZ
MGRVGADGLLPRFIWAAPLVGVVGETARGRRHGGGSLSLSLPVGLRMVAKMTTQQDGVDTLTWALEKNNGYSSRFPCFGEGVYLLLGDVGALCCMDKLEPPAVNLSFNLNEVHTAVQTGIHKTSNVSIKKLACSLHGKKE